MTTAWCRWYGCQSRQGVQDRWVQPHTETQSTHQHRCHETPNHTHSLNHSRQSCWLLSASVLRASWVLLPCSVPSDCSVPSKCSVPGSLLFSCRLSAGRCVTAQRQRWRASVPLSQSATAANPQTQQAQNERLQRRRAELQLHTAHADRLHPRAAFLIEGVGS